MKKMNSINETYKLCKSNNIGISRNILIKLAKDGIVPSVKYGRSILINWDKLIEYLDSSKLDTDDNKTGIRKISA